MGFRVNDFEAVFTACGSEHRVELKNRIIRFWNSLWIEITDEHSKPPTRNTKQLVLDKAIARGNSGLIAIFLTLRLRKDLSDILNGVNEKMRKNGVTHQEAVDLVTKEKQLTDFIQSPGLVRLIKEWNHQVNNPKAFDTLQYVFSVHPHITRTHRAMAMVTQIRRIRAGYKIGESNILIAVKLADEALKLVKGDEDTPVKPFHIVESQRHYEFLIRLQQLLNFSRRANHSETIKMAKKFEHDIINAKENEQFGIECAVRTDLWLRWWSWHVRHRAATLTFNVWLFNKSKSKMDDLQYQLSEDWDGWKGYIDEIKARNIVDHTFEIGEWNPGNLLWKFFELWKKFHPVVDSRIISTSGHNRMDKKIYRDFNKGSVNSRTLYRVIHNNRDSGRQEFQKLSISRRGDKQRRAGTVIAEVKHAHLSIRLSDNYLACLLLELLHRDLIYRLWWESEGYGKGAEGQDESPLLNSEQIMQTIEILNDIKTDLNQWRSDGQEGVDEIGNSIYCLRNLGDDWSRSLRLRLEEFSLPTVENPSSEQRFFMGIPYGEQNADGYEVMHPFGRWIGTLTYVIESENE